MRVKMILPALTEATSPYFRPIKYSLFPPLGLATLAGYLNPDDSIDIQDEHIENLDLTDTPDLVVIEAYITSAKRAYQLGDHYRSRGAYVCIGGVHPSSQPDEAAKHADTVFAGPGEDTWPRFLRDFARGMPAPFYQSTIRSLVDTPPLRRDLIRRNRYLVPNSLVVSRGCPHRCDFCYKEPFFKGGRSFYTQKVDDALAQIEALPGRHLFFLDDNLFANPRFATALFEGMRGMGRLWQAAGTVQAALDTSLLDKAVASGLRSLFVGFESLSEASLREQHKNHNHFQQYRQAIANLQERRVMINASFVFGMDHDDQSVFDHTVDWAIDHGLETATFHILTPYPGTRLYSRLQKQGRILTDDWNLYDTRHSVFQPAHMSVGQLEQGYWRSYRRFYRWSSIFKAAAQKPNRLAQLRHLAYSAGWKKFGFLWNPIVKIGMVAHMRPLLEKILAATKGQASKSLAPQKEESMSDRKLIGIKNRKAA